MYVVNEQEDVGSCWERGAAWRPGCENEISRAVQGVCLRDWYLVYSTLLGLLSSVGSTANSKDSQDILDRIYGKCSQLQPQMKPTRSPYQCDTQIYRKWVPDCEKDENTRVLIFLVWAKHQQFDEMLGKAPNTIMITSITILLAISLTSSLLIRYGTVRIKGSKYFPNFYLSATQNPASLHFKASSLSTTRSAPKPKGGEEEALLQFFFFRRAS